MSWHKLLCSECNGPLEFDCDSRIPHPWFDPYLWCEVCQGGCSLKEWIRWELIESKEKNR